MTYSPECPKIALIGFMGCGKSTVGPSLAARLNCGFVDLDAEIVREANKDIPDIFASSGEPEFRRLETALLRRTALRDQGLVVACGGGIVLAEENRSLLAASFTVVWLDVGEEELIRRLSRGTRDRPLLKERELPERVRSLLSDRSPLYAAASDFIYSWMSGHGAEDSARVIELWLKRRTTA